MASRRLPAPLGVGRVGAAVLGAAEADVEERAVPGVVERVPAATSRDPLPVEQVALLLVVATTPRRRSSRCGDGPLVDIRRRIRVRSSSDGDPAGPEPPVRGHQRGGRAAERGGAEEEQQQRGGRRGQPRHRQLGLV